MLGIISFFLLATDVLRWDLTITTGLSAKNFIIYLLAMFLGLRMVIARTSVVAVGSMQAAFLVQIFYAIFTWLIAALVVKYQGYDLIASGIKLITSIAKRKKWSKDRHDQDGQLSRGRARPPE